MAKNTCVICGAEVNLFTGQQLADKTYICRKVCAKKCLKNFDFIPATIDEVKSHIEQVERGTKVWNQIFVPLQKTNVKEAKLKRFGSQIYVSPWTGLMALVETRYKFIVFGKSQYACVYRIADLASYELEQEKVKNSEGKEETKHYCHLFFHNVAGLYDFRFEVSGELEFKELENYFNKLFGIEKTIGNSINNAKKQWEAIKDMAGAVKAAATGAEDVEEKAQAAYDSLSTYLEGDRTKLIEIADIALSSVQY